MKSRARGIQRNLQQWAVIGTLWSRYAWLSAEPSVRGACRWAGAQAPCIRDGWNSSAGFAARFVLIACMMPAVCGVSLFLYFQRLSAGPIDDNPHSIIAFRWPASPLPLYRSLDDAKQRSHLSRL
jgi:hypothetical protein